MFSTLFEPVAIKDLQVKNRFVRSATAEGMATLDGFPTQELKELYCRLADGEVGLIITSVTCVEAWKHSPEVLGLSSLLLAIHDDRYIDTWRGIIDAVHQRGAKIAMQIGHMGRQESPVLRGSPPIAPSAVPVSNKNVVPREMLPDDIEDMVEKFAQACRRVKEAGFDAVQVLCAHGNLIDNFMSPYTNVRTDNYGGSIEDRSRFAVEIVNRARELIGPDYPMLIKMNFDDFVEGGLQQDDAVSIARILAQAGVDSIEVSGGTLSDSREHIMAKGILKEEDEAYFRTYSKALKEQVSLPLMLVGGLRSPGVMAKIVEEGSADFISMCRPLIREPGLIKRWKNGDLEKAKCISCNKCYDYWLFRPIRCDIDEPWEKDQ